MAVPTPQQAEQVRNAVGAFWIAVLKDLRSERQALRDKDRPLSKAFIEKAAKACDQLRRDFKVEPDAPALPADQPVLLPFGDLQLHDGAA